MAQPADNPPAVHRMTRAEAARHASLVRWKKESAFGKPDPAAIAARVKQILAEKANKGKKKKAKGGKAKHTAKPKDARTPQEKRNQNRAAVAKQSGMEDLEGPLVRIGAGMSSDLEPEAYNKLIEKGLAQRAADGTTTLSPAGRKWKAAADKGDSEGAGAALADGKAAAANKQAKEKDKAEKGAAHDKAKAERQAAQQAKQQARIQKQQALAAQRQKTTAALRKAKQQKAAQPAKAPAPAKEKAPTPDEKQTEKRETAIQDMAKQGVSADSAHALLDFAGGGILDDKTAGALESAGLLERGDDGAHRLTSEGRAASSAINRGNTRAALDAMSRAKDKQKAKKAIDMDAIKAGARHSKTDQQHVQGMHDSSVALGAMCGAPEDDGDAEAAVKAMQDDPLYYAQHECGDVYSACNALSNLAMLIQSELYEQDEDDTDVSQLVDAARILVKFIASELDELEGASGDASDFVGREGTPVKAVDEVVWVEGDAVKALDGGRVGGLAIRFGSEDEPDLSHMRDYFTKSTSFWLDAWDKRPMLYHHALEENTADDPVIGVWTKATVTDEGVWLEGELSKSFKYQTAIKELIRRGALRISTDSAPHLVRRETKNGAHEVTRWPIICASLTPSAAEPRLSAVSLKAILAELGDVAIDDNPEAHAESGERSDETKAVDERARALLLELDLLSLEATT
jgi:hypothetical protein